MRVDRFRNNVAMDCAQALKTQFLRLFGDKWVCIGLIKNHLRSWIFGSFRKSPLLRYFGIVLLGISDLTIGFSQNPSVAIIGGGPSGLVSAKEARQCGLIPTVFEKGDSVGGLWKSNGGKVWESLRINNSYYACSFSDYEWEKPPNDFPNQKEVYQYLCSYARAFHIEDDVLLNSQVTKVEREGSKWRLEWTGPANQQESSVFDFVIVCSGIYSQGFIPEIPGLETFSGRMIHGQDYKTPDIFEGKCVGVIGNAFSGCEIAADIAKTAEKTFHIFNRAKWISPRYLKDKQSDRTLPLDLICSRDFRSKFVDRDPFVWDEGKSQRIYNFYQKQVKLYPSLDFPVTLKDLLFATSDEYLPEIQSGKIIPKLGSLIQIDKNTLFLSDDSTIEADALIFCTGYRTELPFFNAHTQDQLNFQKDDPLQPLALYKTVFHPKFPNMAFIGLSRFPIFFGPIELQARLACMTFSGKIPLPSETEMEEGIREELKIRNMNPRPQFVHDDFIKFSDCLAKYIGALPDFTALKQEDPVLYKKVWDGPFTTASFRLVGFGSNREVALKIIDDLAQKVPTPFLSYEYVYEKSKENF